MSMMPAVGEIVDEVFRVEEELDHGNFGAVFKVKDLSQNRTLAMKVLKLGPHDEEELRQRFEREARLIYSLKHPHVVQVFYYGQTNSGLPYMAMEYLQGTDLKDLLRHHGGLTESLARRITIESLSALHSAHGMGIIHRDLKPANIYLVNDGGRGHVKVLDFGFAKALESERAEEITNAGTLVGTPAYMSPELVHKRDVGPGADIYAMGLILAEMLTGEKVVQIESIYDTILFQGSEKDIKLPKELRRSAFAPIVQKAITKDLSKRYKTALEMIDELRVLHLDGVGPYTEEVRLTTAPPETGTADTEARTRPRADGRPSLDEIDNYLGDSRSTSSSEVAASGGYQNYGAHSEFQYSEEEPTVDRVISNSSGAPKNRRQAARAPTATTSMAMLPEMEPVVHVEASHTEESSAMVKEIAVGLLIGVAVLAGVLAFLH